MATGRIGFFLESDVQDTVNWSRKWLVNFNGGQTQLVLFYRSSNTSGIHLKRIVLRLTFFSKFDWSSYITYIAKTVSKKILTLICSMKFLSREVALYL